MDTTDGHDLSLQKEDEGLDLVSASSNYRPHRLNVTVLEDKKECSRRRTTPIPGRRNQFAVGTVVLNRRVRILACLRRRCSSPDLAAPLHGGAKPLSADTMRFDSDVYQFGRDPLNKGRRTAHIGVRHSVQRGEYLL